MLRRTSKQLHFQCENGKKRKRNRATAADINSIIFCQCPAFTTTKMYREMLLKAGLISVDDFSTTSSGPGGASYIGLTAGRWGGVLATCTDRNYCEFSHCECTTISISAQWPGGRGSCLRQARGWVYLKQPTCGASLLATPLWFIIYKHSQSGKYLLKGQCHEKSCSAEALGRWIGP